jgi:hypothetical protein
MSEENGKLIGINLGHGGIDVLEKVKAISGVDSAEYASSVCLHDIVVEVAASVDLNTLIIAIAAIRGVDKAYEIRD